MMQTPKTRTSASPARTATKGAQQLKKTALDLDSASSSSSSSASCKTLRGRSPKALEQKTPRTTPVSEVQKKYPNRVSGLESNVSELKEDLKKAKEQLILSESLKTQAQRDAEELKKELLAMSLKFEESQKKLEALSASETEFQGTSDEHDRAWQYELKPAANHQYSVVNSTTLAPAIDEISFPRNNLRRLDESEALQNIVAKSANDEILNLEKKLAENYSVLEGMKIQLRNCKESETQARTLVSETLMQLEDAKNTIETLKSDGMKSTDAYNSTASELEQSRARVSLVEELVNKLKLENPTDKRKVDESEPVNVQFEMGRLRSTIETAEIRYRGQEIQSAVETRTAHELLKIKSTAVLREAALEAELQKAKADIEELKVTLLDKETELQCIMEENEGLTSKHVKCCLLQRECELETKLKESEENVVSLKADLMDKETELQNILEENETLTLEVEKGRMQRAKASDELEKVRASESEALMKLGLVMEDVEKSTAKVARVAEQLEASQVANSEMEVELRKLMVQSNQWRKAAETAAAMLSASTKGEFMDTARSLDSSKNDGPTTGKITSPCCEDMGDDSPRKRNGNVLKKITVLWKKQQK